MVAGLRPQYGFGGRSRSFPLIRAPRVTRLEHRPPSPLAGRPALFPRMMVRGRGKVVSTFAVDGGNVTELSGSPVALPADRSPMGIVVL